MFLGRAISPGQKQWQAMRIEFPDINFHSTNKSPIMEWRASLFWVLPPQDRECHIGSKFSQFYLIKTSFTLGEAVSLVKVFRLFRLERIVFAFRASTEYVDVQHLIYGRTDVFVMPSFFMDGKRHAKFTSLLPYFINLVTKANTAVARRS